MPEVVMKENMSEVIIKENMPKGDYVGKCA